MRRMDWHKLQGKASAYEGIILEGNMAEIFVLAEEELLIALA